MPAYPRETSIASTKVVRCVVKGRRISTSQLPTLKIHSKAIMSTSRANGREEFEMSKLYAVRFRQGPATATMHWGLFLGNFPGTGNEKDGRDSGSSQLHCPIDWLDILYLGMQ